MSTYYQSGENTRLHFMQMPAETAGYTMITCMHPVHSMSVYYLSTDDWQANIKFILTPYWINGYTITMMPMD